MRSDQMPSFLLTVVAMMPLKTLPLRAQVAPEKLDHGKRGMPKASGAVLPLMATAGAALPFFATKTLLAVVTAPAG